jgi:hypothetical protein
MPRSWAPSLVPDGDDQNVFLVVDDFGRYGRAYRETDVADLETVIIDLLYGQYNNPIRVVGFNTAEGWSQDVSADVADELRRRCASITPLPSALALAVWSRSLTLPSAHWPDTIGRGGKPAAAPPSSGDLLGYDEYVSSFPENEAMDTQDRALCFER